MNSAEARKLLDVGPSATDDEINSAFRKKAKELHPDNKETGNEVEFKKLGEAKSILLDPQPRQQTHYRTGNGPDIDMMEEVKRRFAEAMGGFSGNRQMVQNILFNIDLDTAFNGGRSTINMTGPDGDNISRDIIIPKGIGQNELVSEFEESGITVRLIANIISEDFQINWHPFQRGTMAGEAHISALKMITGGWEELPILGGKKVRVFITPGFKTGQILKVKGKGFWGDTKCSKRGDLMLRVFPIIKKFEDFPKSEIDAFVKLAKGNIDNKTATLDIKV